ncbi:MAG: PEP-CTERM sorting domain-containing protein [bacterium]|nr:PEP-CTERM sorting domain-containing protein [bacterium]
MSIILGSACCVAQASTKTIWVDGVNKDGGWYDVNKENPWIQDGDNDLCWAATATNLITWWQDKYEVPEGIPNTKEEIWDTFKEKVNYDKGGDVHGAIQWWVSGVYTPLNYDESLRSIYGIGNSTILNSFDGYYHNRYQLNFYYDVWPFLEVESRPPYGDTTNYLAGIGDDLLELVGKGCGVGLSIGNDAGKLAHALTLWGIEYDEISGDITKFWLTDSDDEQFNFNMDGLFTVAVTEKNGKLYINTTENDWYATDNDVFVNGVFAINPDYSDTWGIPLARTLLTLSIPEPSTAALSLLALAGLAARRRRGTY